MKSVLQRSTQLMDQNKPFAFVTIVESKGSSPRHQAKMLVEADGQITGTIGGGPVELQIIGKAQDCIRQNRNELFTYTLDKAKEEGLPMMCGGDMTFFIEVVSSVPEIVLIGGGHVGYALSRMCDVLGYPYHVIDERPELTSLYPGALSFHSAPTINRAIREARDAGSIGPYSYVTIFTSNADETALEVIMQDSYPYVGMIGSAKKVGGVFNNLRAKGVSLGKLKKVHTPIGLKINAETPEEIAISILGEIISVYRSH